MSTNPMDMVFLPELPFMDMILFKDDWRKFPTAIVDYNTTNGSFLRLVDLYARMGVDNCEFPLALLQPDLVGVDPYDPDLDQVTMGKIFLEAKYNPWYHFRELSRIPPNSGNKPVRFIANRGNIALYWSFFNSVDFGLLQPRQTGKSVSTDVLNEGIIDIWGENTTTYLITKDHALRANNIQRLKKMRSLLPEYIYYPGKGDVDNSEMLTNIRLSNFYKTAVGRSDEVGADKLGRGLTVPILHFDELAYISLIGISLPVALGAGSAAREEAEANDQPFGNVYTTTAGSLNKRDGQFAYNFLTSGAEWTEKFFDCKDKRQLKRLVEKQCVVPDKRDKRSVSKPLIYGAFNHRQLGKDDMWLFKKLREVAATGDIADRDWMNVWTTGSEGSPLSLEDKQAINGSLREPDYVQITDEGYILRWYIPEDQINQQMENEKFVLAVDPSEGLGADADATGFVVINIRTHDVVCVGRYNETNIVELAKFIGRYLIKYPNVTFIPERKSTGTTIINTLFLMLPLENIDPFKRIFNRIVDEKENFEKEFEEVRTRHVSSRSPSFYERYTRYFGYNTGSGRHGRDNLYGEALKSMLRIGAARIYDRALGNEITGLTTRNGRIDHSRGQHDDLVISLLLTHWFCTKARNLDYYGIDSRRIFVDARVRKNVSAEDVYKEEHNKELTQQFEALIEELTDVDDPMIISRIEMKIRRLSQRIDITEGGGIGIDAMIKQAKESRDRRIKMSRYQTRGGRITNTASPYQTIRGITHGRHTQYI